MTTPTDAQIDALWAEACKRDHSTRDMVRAFARAAIAAAQPVPDAPAEPLKGWKLNHVRPAEEGVAEIGFLDDEDDRFSPIVTVDTGLYYQPDQALPLAVAILGMLQDAAAHPQQPARAPLTDEQIEQVRVDAGIDGTPMYLWILSNFARAIEAAHGIVPAPTTAPTPDCGHESCDCRSYCKRAPTTGEGQ